MDMNAPLIISIVVLAYYAVLIFRTDRELPWKSKDKQKPEDQ
jgi:hypothetical protein